MKIRIILSFLISLSVSCTSSNPKEKRGVQVEKSITQNLRKESFEIIDEIKSETRGKTQLIEYAIYKDTIYTQSALKDAVLDIYNLYRDKHVFKSDDVARILVVYLFTSKDAHKDKSNWVAMLIKRPNVEEPEITFNDFKVAALSSITDKVKSKDEIELEKLKGYLKKRGLDLCSLSDLLKKMELDNIHKADATYPDYGDEHMAMIDRLDAESYRSLKRKYKLNEDMLSKVSVFAMSYCK